MKTSPASSSESAGGRARGADPGFDVRLRRAWLPVVLGAVLVAGATACGRRGPPLPPVRVTPEEPRLLPLQQEGGEIVVRWVAPSRAAGGDSAELRLRRAVVLHRVVDLERRIGEARAARRAETAAAGEEPEPPEGEDAPAEDLAGEEAAEGEPSTAGVGETPALSGEPGDTTAPDERTPSRRDPAEPAGAPPGVAAAGDAVATAPPEGAGPTASEPGVAASEAVEPEAERPAETGGEQPAESGEEPPAGTGGERSAAPGEEHPTEPGGEQPAESGGEPPAGTGGERPAAPGEEHPEEAAAAGEQPGEPGEERPAEPGGEGSDESAETGSAEPVEEVSEEPGTPTGVVLQYDEGEELEVLSEVESETPGEERTLRLPVQPDWVRRRLIVALRYESGTEPSGESERREIDVAAPLPDAGPVTTTVEASGVALAWPDVRPGAAAAAPLSNPLFEIVRRRGTDSAQAARIPVPRWTDGSVNWGEEVCYSVRLVVVGDDEPRTMEDPGPEFDPALPDSTEAEADPAAAPPEAAAPTEGAPSSDPPDAGGFEAGGEEGRDAGAPEEGADEATAAPESGEDPPTPIDPAGVGAGAGTEGADPPPGGTPGGTPGTDATPSWQPIPVEVPPTGSRTMSAGKRSREVCLVPEDTFAPPAPTDLRAFWRPEATELNWRAADAPDVRGYVVYRSQAEGSGYERLTPEPVAAASFSDRERDPETLYYYSVAALDTVDPPNESPRSAPVPVRPRSR